MNPAAGRSLGRGERLRSTARDFALISLSLLPILLLLRGYEFLVVRTTHVLPAGAAGILFRGSRSDVALTLWLAALIAIPIIAVAQWLPRGARRAHRIALVIVVVAGIALIQYFAVTFVPLGADLFGYSLRYIPHVARTSGGIGLLSLVAPIMAGALTWYLSGFVTRFRMSGAAVMVFFCAVIGAVAFRESLSLKPTEFSSETDYFLAANKTAYFAGRTAEYLAARWSPSRATTLTGFPLLHPASYDDVLGPLFNAGTRKPNLVFIIVEGLGRDFVGEGARYGGFMPFLDSLTKRSLYWENFVSTSGRTFSMLPSLLGSLPFAENGLMGLGSRMPHHLSLLSLLKQGGYTTSFFSGTNGQFEFIDGFMERQGVDRFIDESSYGRGYEKEPADKGGISWGYPDGEIFRRSFEVLGPGASQPRLDIYVTVTMHEPFIPPRTAQYLAEFQRRLAALPVAADRREEYLKYVGIFSTLLYMDDALRYFFAEYAKREEFARTVFFITGDHRLIPIPSVTRIDRFHVPFLIFSPLVKAPRRFSSVSSHLDVAPSVLAFMHRNYAMSFPDSVHWLGTGIDTARQFRNIHSLAIMPIKNQLDTYLDGVNFLSGDQLFRLEENFSLREVDDPSTRKGVREKLERFRELNRFVTTGEHLYPKSRSGRADSSEIVREDSVFHALGLDGKNPTEVLEFARQDATQGRYDRARLILQRTLRSAPSSHDARALLAQTYAWQRRFDEGRPILQDLVRRAPEYLDGHLALIDLEIFAGHGKAALAASDSALAWFSLNHDLLLRRARALEILGRRRDALAALNTLPGGDANNPAVAELRKRLIK